MILSIFLRGFFCVYTKAIKSHGTKGVPGEVAGKRRAGQSNFPLYLFLL